MKKKCPKCEKPMVKVLFRYDPKTGEVFADGNKRFMCLTCGLQKKRMF